MTVIGLLAQERGSALTATAKSPGMERRLFHFSYSLHQSRPEPLLHALRDGDAFAELEAVLLKQDYDYQGLILNFPRPDFEISPLNLGSSDLVVMTTRPPHPDEWDKKGKPATGEKFERMVLDVVNKYFVLHSRSLVLLQSEMSAKLKKPDRGEINFRQRNGARYKRHRMAHVTNRKQREWQTPEHKELTAAFVLYTNLWSGGPLFLNAFGMDGPTTLIWCYLLRTRFSQFLKPHRFVMAELMTEPFPSRPQSLSFADKWQVDILLDEELPDGIWHNSLGVGQ